MNINFDKDPSGLIPAIIQDAETLKVLMMGYMNAAAYQETVATGKVTFYSRSRQSLWTKGETSGNYLQMVSISLDCDGDTLLIKAKPDGPTCHTGADTCWNESNDVKYGFLSDLSDIIHQRKIQPKEGSYTSELFQKGINKIAQKVGEEAVEVVIEAKDHNDELFKNEAADLLFHLLILLEEKQMNLDDVVSILRARHK